MQLRNNLYTITDKEVNGLFGSFTIELNPSHFIYKAHFPNEPITPGVCIVQIGKELLELLLEKKHSDKLILEITKVKNVKFLSVISPRETTTVIYQMRKVEMSEDGGEIKAQIVVISKEKVMAKISLVLKMIC